MQPSVGELVHEITMIRAPQDFEEHESCNFNIFYLDEKISFCRTNIYISLVSLMFSTSLIDPVE